MIFGNPYRFAIWADYVPHWGESYKNGLFYLIINGNLYPKDIRTSTLSSDLYEITDDNCALVSHPKNYDIFSLPTKSAFKRLSDLAYPKSTKEDEYPEQIFDYCITAPNVNNSGGCFFAVANDKSLRIIGGVTERLVVDSSKEKNVWECIDRPKLEDITLSRYEINEIIINIKKYKSSLFK